MEIRSFALGNRITVVVNTLSERFGIQVQSGKSVLGYQMIIRVNK